MTAQAPAILDVRPTEAAKPGGSANWLRGIGAR
jgi:hypothetical protein